MTCQALSSSLRSAFRWISGTFWRPGRRPANTQQSVRAAANQKAQSALGRLSPLSHLEASFPFLNVLFGVEEDDVDLGHVEHPEGHKGAEGHGDGQRGGLDEHLWRHSQEKTSLRCFPLEVVVLVLLMKKEKEPSKRQLRPSRHWWGLQTFSHNMRFVCL